MISDFRIYYLGVNDNEKITLFDNAEIVNKVMEIRAEDIEVAIKMFTRKTGIAKRNIVGIKMKCEYDSIYHWV